MPSMFCLTCGRLSQGSRCGRCERGWLSNYGAAHRAERRHRIEAGERCARCGSTQDLELDHVKPIRGGRNQGDARRQILCRKCNRDKG